MLCYPRSALLLAEDPKKESPEDRPSQLCCCTVFAFWSHEQIMVWWNTYFAHKVEAPEPETIEGLLYQPSVSVDEQTEPHLTRTKTPHRDRLRLSQMSLVQRNCVVWWNHSFQMSKPQVTETWGQKFGLLPIAAALLYLLLYIYIYRLVLLEYLKIWDEISYHIDFKY